MGEMMFELGFRPDGRRGGALRTAAAACALVSAALLASCGRVTKEAPAAAAPASELTPARITVVGSSTIAPLIGEIAKRFEQGRPGTRVDVQAGGSARGLIDVRQGTAQIGMVSRALKPDEADLARVLIGRDGLGIIVHSANPIRTITKPDVVAIFSGKVSNWKQLGGADVPITVVSKAEGRSTLEIFSQYFGLPYREIRAKVVIGDNQQGIQMVAGAPGAIGYVSIGAAEYEAAHGTAIRLLAFDGHVPSTSNVASGSYPITRELNLVFKAPALPPVQALLDMAQSRQVADLIEAQFFVPPAR